MNLFRHLPLSLILPVAVVGAVGLACGSSTSTAADDTAGGDDAGDPGNKPETGNDGTDSGGGDSGPAPTGPLKTVFVIMMENHSWSTIKGSASAAYINGTLVPMGAHAEQYSTPPSNHPSEPNYVWLEAGDNLGITDDNPPSANHQATTDHLVTQLETAGITWKAYAEGITAGTCPLAKIGSDYDPKHTPQLFFDDVTNTNKTNAQRCIDHIRPYTELADDLSKGTVARYNFITPNLCNDMHGEVNVTCPAIGTDLIKKGDDWLSTEVPKILASQAFKDNGVLFVLWDEGDEPLFGSASDGPIPLIVLSPKAKKGFSSATAFTHSSLLRTIQSIFKVPYLRGAQTSNDLSEMFTSFP